MKNSKKRKASLPKIIDYPTDPAMRANIIKRFKKITDTPEFKKSVEIAKRALEGPKRRKRKKK